MKPLLFLLSVFLLATSLRAQCADGNGDPDGRGPGVSFVPLYLFTNGPGQIVIGPAGSHEDDQTFEVGRPLMLTAVPERGCKFIGWNKVNVFVFDETVEDEFGSTSSITSVVASPVPPTITGPVLQVQVQPWTVLYDVPGVRVISQGIGWQANFEAEPIPELLRPVLPRRINPP